MIKEIINFMQNVDDELKSLAIKPKEGLHIILKTKLEAGNYVIDFDNIETQQDNKGIITAFMKKCIQYQSYVWTIDFEKKPYYQKCLDTPQKGIHSVSPFCFATKIKSLEGGEKYLKDTEGNGLSVYQRVERYFKNAQDFIEDESLLLQIVALQDFVRNKERLHSFLDDIPQFKDLEPENYIIIYLDLNIRVYKSAYLKYLESKIFNVSTYNTKVNDENMVFGLNGFLNSLNADKPYLTHQTATFEINSRISIEDALILSDFKNIASLLPTPLPIFIFKEELKKDAIAVFKEEAKQGKKRGYAEIIGELYKNHSNDFSNYYLLYHQYGILKDFDFVSRFDFELKDENGNPWLVRNLFNLKFEPTIKTVFDFQNIIVWEIFNNGLVKKEKDNSLKYRYFDDKIEEKYCKTPNTYLLIMKYRKAFYDFVYKARFEVVTKSIFDEILQTLLIDDIHKDEFKKNNHSQGYSIAAKLNIWFSLSHLFFNPNKNSINMANELKEHQQLMQDLIEGKKELSSESEFAFASGQIIKYLLSKSKGADKSHARLEAFMQQSNYDLFIKAIIRLFNQYKHVPMTLKFERVMAQIMNYENDKNNLTNFTKNMLAGYFSGNTLFSDKDKNEFENLDENLEESEENN
jgi:CRISPR-associated protein Csh1